MSMVLFTKTLRSPERLNDSAANCDKKKKILVNLCEMSRINFWKYLDTSKEHNKQEPQQKLSSRWSHSIQSQTGKTGFYCIRKHKWTLLNLMLLLIITQITNEQWVEQWKKLLNLQKPCSSTSRTPTKSWLSFCVFINYVFPFMFLQLTHLKCQINQQHPSSHHASVLIWNIIFFLSYAHQNV